MSLTTRLPLAFLLIFVIASLLPTACGEGIGTEICGDGIDNDHDGVIDEGVDEDGDTYRSCDIPDLIDCDDNNAAVHPGAIELCDGLDNDCDPAGAVDDVDIDGDGYISSDCGGLDCDDNDEDAHPGRPESCDFADNDCDGEIDEGFDADNDTWSFCAGDCDNTDPLINPDATEICDGIDNDCDCSHDSSSGDSNGDGERCGPGDENVDEDFDLDGDHFVDASNAFCFAFYGPGGPGEAVGDCDDDPITGPTVFPHAHEDSSDGLDNDCDGCIDECQDEDGDGWDTCDPGPGGGGAVASDTCTGPLLPDDGLAADCNDRPTELDLFAEYMYPGFEAVETRYEQDFGLITVYDQCDTVDNNCDGCIDEGYISDCSGLVDPADFLANGPGPCTHPVP